MAYRQLTVPGVAELTGRGVFYGSALTEATSCADHDIYIVGGANSAGQAAVYLARAARSVTMLVRGSSLEKSMSHYLIQQVAAIPAITVRTCTEVAEAHGTDHLERLTLRDSKTGATETVDAQWLFVFIGAAPLTGWLDGVVQRDERGFVLAGPGPAGRRRAAAGTGRLTGRRITWRRACRGLRRRRCPGRVRQAGRLRGRRGRDGRHAGAPLPGEAVTAVPGDGQGGPPASCSEAELRELFLFEKLTDDQLAWLCREGAVIVAEPGTVYVEGEPADFLVRAAGRRRW